jgi:hypothetical protein
VALGLFGLLSILIYAYAHKLQQWPTLKPMDWYLPFLLSVALSTATLIKSYHFYVKKHSLLLMISGICIAGGLTSWNLKVLHIATYTGQNASGLSVWEPKDMTEALIAYELNICRGTRPSSDTSVSSSRYQQMFKEMPRDQWKAYFKLYLNSSEMQSVNSINVHEMMKVVAARMYARRSAQWAEFQALYESPTFSFMIKQWALYPYIKVLNMVE